MTWSLGGYCSTQCTQYAQHPIMYLTLCLQRHFALFLKHPKTYCTCICLNPFTSSSAAHLDFCSVRWRMVRRVQRSRKGWREVGCALEEFKKILNVSKSFSCCFMSFSQRISCPEVRSRKGEVKIHSRSLRTICPMLWTVPHVRFKNAPWYSSPSMKVLVKIHSDLQNGHIHSSLIFACMLLSCNLGVLHPFSLQDLPLPLDNV